MSRHWLWAFGLYGALNSACTPAAPERLIEPHASSVRLGKVPSPLAAAAAAPIACFADLICLADIRLPKGPVQAGGRVSITYFWSVRREPGRSWKAFLHGSTSASAAHRFNDDHHPGSPNYPMARWAPGDLIRVTRSLSLAKNLPSDRYELWGGFFQGAERMRVSSGMDDGRDRARFGVIRVEGKKVPKPRARVQRLKTELSIDGRLDEPAWSKAERLGPFWHYDGEGRGRYQTYARLLWDDQALYLAFEAPDTDVHTPYSKRDDPIYESEAVEIFIDADGDGDEYIELQVAPNGVQFDARFKGGARQNMDQAWNHEYQAKVHIDGTLNDPSDKDRGWTAEWRIPYAGIPDLASAPKVGQSWKINLFRLERIRRGGKVVGTDATAWSAPLSGDFHRLERFGVITFAP
jgi:hypothetical protein